jgi:hypothetical protein
MADTQGTGLGFQRWPQTPLSDQERAGVGKFLENLW